MGETKKRLEQDREKLRAKLQQIQAKFDGVNSISKDSAKQLAEQNKKWLDLVQKKAQLTQQLRQEQIILTQIEALAQKAKDPVVALNVTEKLLGRPLKGVPTQFEIDKRFADLQIDRTRLAQQLGEKHPEVILLDRMLQMMPREMARKSDDHFVDLTQELPQIHLDEQLVPLMVERNKFANQFGQNHPGTKALNAEIDVMKAELKRLAKEQTERMVALIKENAKESEATKAGYLLPLLLERNNQCEKLGENHPVVKCLDLLSTAAESKFATTDPKIGRNRVAAEIYAAKAKVSLLKQQVSLIETEIAKLKLHDVKPPASAGSESPSPTDD